MGCHFRVCDSGISQHHFFGVGCFFARYFLAPTLPPPMPLIICNTGNPNASPFYTQGDFSKGS